MGCRGTFILVCLANTTMYRMIGVISDAIGCISVYLRVRYQRFLNVIDENDRSENDGGRLVYSINYI